MHPKPSELGSQAGVGLPSTAEGDHAGTSGVVSSLFCFFDLLNVLWCSKTLFLILLMFYTTFGSVTSCRRVVNRVNRIKMDWWVIFLFEGDHVGTLDNVPFCLLLFLFGGGTHEDIDCCSLLTDCIKLNIGLISIINNSIGQAFPWIQLFILWNI